MPLPTLKNLISPLTPQTSGYLARDITWDRPVFRPPVLNPRIMFDPLPFTAHRMVPARRQNAKS
jgi:hypothetical protein